MRACFTVPICYASRHCAGLAPPVASPEEEEQVDEKEEQVEPEPVPEPEVSLPKAQELPAPPIEEVFNSTTSQCFPFHAFAADDALTRLLSLQARADTCNLAQSCRSLTYFHSRRQCRRRHRSFLNTQSLHCHPDCLGCTVNEWSIFSL